MDNKVTIKIDVDKSAASAGFHDMRTESDKLGEQISRDTSKRLSESKSRFAKSGKDAGGEFVGGFGKSAPALAGVMNPAVIGAIAGLAPLAGATLAAAVVGGAAGIGIIGGVMLAAKDPRVRAAGTSLGQNLTESLTKDADVFVAPVLQSIGTIQNAFTTQLRPAVQNIFKNTAPMLEPLTKGALTAVTGIVRGIEAATSKAAPVIGAISDLIGHAGQSVGTFMEKMAGQADNGARAIKNLDSALTTTIGVVGDVAVVLSETYGAFDRVNKGVEKVTGNFTNLTDIGLPGVVGQFKQAWPHIQETRKQFEKTAPVIDRVAAGAIGLAEEVNKAGGAVLTAGEAAGDAGMHMGDFGQSMVDATNKARGLYDAETAVAQAMDDTKKAIEKNGKTLDINTDKGRENRRMLSDLAGKLSSADDGFRKVGQSSSDAARRGNSSRDSFIRVARQMGATQKQAEQLADKMGLIKTKKVDFLVNTHDAAGRLAAAQDRINRMHGKTVTVRVSVSGLERLDNLGHRIGGYKASGGVVGAASGGVRSNMTLVGEHGPELVNLPPGSRVNSNEDSMRMMSGNGSGNSGVIVVPVYLDGKEIARAMADPMRHFVGSNFGGSVQAAYGK
ncbi:MAG: hypothetical protein ABWY81_11060 [Jiangellaceae bacterium]